MKLLRGYFLILGATIFWGISATVARFLFTQQMDTLILVQSRMSLSCLLLLGYFLFFKREYLRVRPADLYQFALLGIVGGAGSNFTYYFTIKESNVAAAILLQYLAPVMVLLHAAFSREESLSVSKISACVVSLAGCFLAVGVNDASLPGISRAALLSGLASAFCWGFTNIMLRRLLKHYSVWTALIYSMVFASAFWLFFNPPWELARLDYPPSTWWTLLLFAVCSILIPHSLYYSGLQYLTASRAIITATFEPIVAIVSAFLLLGETLGPVQILGALLVISAIMILQLRKDSGVVLQPDPLP